MRNFVVESEIHVPLVGHVHRRLDIAASGVHVKRRSGKFRQSHVLQHGRLAFRVENPRRTVTVDGERR